ncbi:MAG TPA: copper chaperone PCu(A)C [Sphingobium sp.]|nr:copper chaperone PCu(A)C [Sphingobium sp.]
MRRGLFLIGLSLSALAALSACDSKPLYVDGGYVRLNANPSAPSAAYFTIHGGDKPVVLRDVTSESAVRLELHESKTQNGMASMAKIDTVDVPAGEKVTFTPGGKHIMLWQINPETVAAGKMTFTFIFSNGDRILADAVIQRPDGSAPDHAAGASAAADEHAGH